MATVGDIGGRFDHWQPLLAVSTSEGFELHTSFDLPNQDIIKADIERVQSGSLSQTERELLECFLTKYCKEENISYKQCMNEICAPFVLMTRNGVPTHVSYQYFKGFVQITMPAMFADPDFRPLQAYFLIFRIVLRYHEPRLSAFFQLNNITPELYTTSWFLTAFAFKIDDLNLLYTLWYELLLEKDQLFLVYISIAFLQNFRSLIINKEDSLIAHAISHLSIATIEDLTSILQRARNIKKSTPYSTRLRLMQYNFYSLDRIDETIISLEQEYCLILPVQEILHMAYPESKICDCIHVRCLWCAKRKEKTSLMVIDCRTKKEQSSGVIPNTLLLPEETYKNHQTVLDYPDQFLESRGSVHICLMGSTNFKTSSFDIKQGSENGEGCEVQIMIENLLQAFLIKGFPYISVVDGGFEQCHEFITYFELELIEHNPKKCKFCLKDQPSYSILMKNKLKQTFMGRVKEPFEEKKRSKSQDQDKSETEFTVNTMLKNRKTEGFKCWIYDKKSNKDSEEKYVLLFNDLTFAYGRACPHEKFPVSLAYYAKLDSLLKITSLREFPSVLNFIFAGQQNVMSFKFKSKDIARHIINQMKKYYAELRSPTKK
ncbi:hypothetical protein SteCoe_27443 [Stentor coeruleus]|uniref:Rab-GAP TBC domain-containing protein n=1 Tax=Stentor coeruleus TaxID=5963 RepID=A0A1R2BAH3_9CILI|nr:hypothetical protein SteCoe_27443 [Stentor coeruleus]